MTAGEIVAGAVVRWLAAQPPGAPPLVVGLCGPQGAGKSTIAAAVSRRVAGAAVLSLDDVYLDRVARARLAAEIHPLLATRGVPGTHDVGLAVDVLSRLKHGMTVALPRFDKATDSPAPRASWPRIERATVVVFEGWCIGARPQDAGAIAAPVNDLERECDADGRWRRFVNAQLAGAYVDVFAPLDRLILLHAPDWPTIVGWRQAAERAGPRAMSDAEVARFCSHYERLTRHVADEMQGRADLVIDLATDRSVVSVRQSR